MYAITTTSYRSIVSADDLQSGESAVDELSAELLAALACADMRLQRDNLLRLCDWTQVVDAPLTDAERAAWLSYRQALRGIPDQPGFPTEIQWPDVPDSNVT